MGKQIGRRRTAIGLLVFLLAVFLLPAYPTNTFGAVPKLDTIRVALFLNSGKLSTGTSLVTLTTGKALAVEARFPTGGAAISGLSGTTTLRAGLDQFSVLALDTNDFAKVKTLRGYLQDSNRPVTVLSRVRQGKASFQVIVGPYPTMTAASSAVTDFAALPGVSALVDNPKLQGPLHWSAGGFQTEADAVKKRTALSQAGVDGDIVVTFNASGALAYEVWVGSETDTEGLAAVKQQAQKAVPGLALAAADTTKPYLVKRDDLTLSATGTNPVPYAAIGTKDLRLWVTPVEGRITVKEKAGRSYRGAMELSSQNSKLALINELPFEQYLYSVVRKELGDGWPAEAMKAQAVAARTYALGSGLKYQVAHVSDTTLDQVYDGTESAASIQAVDETKGEVLTDQNGLIITAFFSANAGGMTSNGQDVWGKSLPYLKSVPSPDDAPALAAALWRQVVLADGTFGFVHGDYLQNTGIINPAGLPIYECTDQDVNVRAAPYVDNVKNPPITQLDKGERVVALREATASNSYSWERGPYSLSDVEKMMDAVLKTPVTGDLRTLSVTARGDSGRVTELSVNGSPIEVSSPDAYRSLFGSLPSTRFEIQYNGGYTIQGAYGAAEDFSAAEPVYTVAVGGQAVSANGRQLYAISGDGAVKPVTGEPQVTFIGTGNGHGVGMSQWGARSLAEMGYDYRYILSYYYEGVILAKE